MLTRRYQLLLLAAVVLAAFYPAVLADFSRIDDTSMAEGYRSIQGWDLGFFIPFSGQSTYYRPLLGLSFLIDKYFLGLLPGLMHLENILFHLLNAVLVYFLTLYFLPPASKNGSLLPLLSALLFGLHPITTESVNWISGRTDVLAGTFILSSALCIMRFKEHREKRYAILSIIAFFCGVLVKETALAFLPGAFLLVSAVPQHGNNDVVRKQTQPSRRISTYSTILFLPIVVAALLFYLPRFSSIRSHTSRIWFTQIAITTDWMHSMFVMLRSFGFYLKKFVFPYPLNFAIMEVDPFYEVPAVLLLALCIYVATRRTAISAMFTTGVMLIIPSFLLAFGQIAWTPYAERYIYLSSAFLMVASTVHLKDAFMIRRTMLKFAVLAVLFIMFLSTLSRSVVWQSDLKLAKDTVEKSPMSRDMRLVYSTLLMEQDDYAEALYQLEQAKTIPLLEYNERFDLNAANIYFNQGRIDEAIKYSEMALQKTHGLSKRALRNLIDLTERKKDSCRRPWEKRLFDKKIFAYYLQLFKLEHDPHHLYYLGKTATELGDDKRALRLFEQTRNNLPPDDPYVRFAQKNIDMLKANLQKNVYNY